MRKTTAFSIAVLTLSTAALAQVGSTPGDKATANNSSASSNSSWSNTTAPTDNTSTPDHGAAANSSADK